jgi:hypothetical protein
MQRDLARVIASLDNGNRPWGRLQTSFKSIVAGCVDSGPILSSAGS